LAGTLAQKNAEVLSGVVIGQLIRKGAPLLIVSGSAKLDMATQNAAFATAEGTLMQIASAQICEHYGIPTHSCVPTSDSHCLNQQIGIENMKSIFMNIAGGTSLIVNAGMFAGGQTAAFEQIVIDNEIVKLSRRLMAGIEVNQETLVPEAIRSVGPMGNYLMEDSTLSNLRSGEWLESEIFVRENYETWRSSGGKTIVDNAADVVERLRNRDDVALPREKHDRIQSIIEDFEKQHG